MSRDEEMIWLNKINKKKSNNPTGVLIVQMLLIVLSYCESKNEPLSREIIQKEIDKL